ncbi:MAG TPA: hypothetical protein VN833_08130, partial [Candidatus Acidoferrales bacterium]|nr:hypothetical protein [Candidatus Acidoferrales bacterium]
AKVTNSAILDIIAKNLDFIESSSRLDIVNSSRTLPKSSVQIEKFFSNLRHVTGPPAAIPVSDAGSDKGQCSANPPSILSQSPDKPFAHNRMWASHRRLKVC